MSQLLKKLFGIGRSHDVAVGGVVMPSIKQTRLEQSMEPGNMRIKGIPLMRSNFRRLERNKYAPWGRGDLSGLPA